MFTLALLIKLSVKNIVIISLLSAVIILTIILLVKQSKDKQKKND